MLKERQALRVLIITFAISLMVLSLSCKKQQETTGEQDYQNQPERVLQKYFKALEEKDYETAMSYFSKESMAQLSTAETKQSFYQFANHVQYVEYLVLEQKVEGDTARVVVSGYTHLTSGDKLPLDNQVYNFVKEDGEWKMVL
jgi:uncharacterized protein YchJ